MSTPTDTITIENVVAATELGQEIDLNVLGSDLAGTDYDPDHFPRLVYRLQEPKVTTLIFRSGRIVCTGAQSGADRGGAELDSPDLWRPCWACPVTFDGSPPSRTEQAMRFPRVVAEV